MDKDYRKLVVKTLVAFEQSKSRLNLILKPILNSSNIDSRTRNRTKVVAYEIIRYKDRFDFIINLVSNRRVDKIDLRLKSIIRLGCYELIFDPLVPDYAAINSAVDLTKFFVNNRAASMVNAILQRLNRKVNSDEDWLDSLSRKIEWLSYPKWLFNKWEKQFGTSRAVLLCNKYNNPSSMFLRVDVSKQTADNVIIELEKDKIKTKKFKLISNFLIVLDNQKDVTKNSLFLSGAISIQDPASAAIIYLLDLKPGEEILDVCAAPGTKSLLMAEVLKDECIIHASDIDPERVRLGINDMGRHKYSSINWSVLDASKDSMKKVNKILIDAPCTGTGVISKKPDIKWRRSLNDVSTMIRLQYSILSNTAKYLRKGGVLVYSTCSVENEENSWLIKKFLSKNKNFSLSKDIGSVPSSWIDKKGFFNTVFVEDAVSGMFAAKLIKSW